jgi:DNA-directed RNA polymerase specialized sigma subunit
MSTKKAPTRGYLATPLSRDEQRRITLLYREHGGLVNFMGRNLCRKYPSVRAEDIYSCIDIAFIKTCRAWNPDKGTFSTLLGVFSLGEVRHFIRDHNWSIKAPAQVRTLGVRARAMLRAGHHLSVVCEELGTTPDETKQALLSLQSLDHDIRGFRDHICPRPTPWDVLEYSEWEDVSGVPELVGAN